MALTVLDSNGLLIEDRIAFGSALNEAEQAVRRRIARTQGVRQIDGWTFSLDPDTRLVTMSAQVTTIYGQILITEVM
ncbi:MAG: hypothetical protein ACREVA_00245 [Burkholderiales bacterium]